ncbi:MAG: hypothetical protein ABIO81_12520 [Ginsengibacter sp.]
MEQDKHMKEILSKGAESASVNFTETVMNRVNDLSTSSLYYEPLVSKKMKKAFIFTFAVVILLLLVLCFIGGATDIPFINLLKIPQLPSYIYFKISVFIFLFWFVFTLNFVIEKNTRLKALL